VVVWAEEAGTEVQSVGRDVTDRMEAERALAGARDAAEAASRAKSRFLAMGVARNPHAAERASSAWPSFCATRR